VILRSGTVLCLAGDQARLVGPCDGSPQVRTVAAVHPHPTLLDDWLLDDRQVSGQELRQALQRYAEARRQLDELTRQLRRAERHREPEPLIADVRNKVHVAAAVERLAYQQAVELHEQEFTGPDAAAVGLVPELPVTDC
jgi:hypothetical protein